MIKTDREVRGIWMKPHAQTHNTYHRVTSDISHTVSCDCLQNCSKQTVHSRVSEDNGELGQDPGPGPIPTILISNRSTRKSDSMTVTQHTQLVVWKTFKTWNYCTINE